MVSSSYHDARDRHYGKQDSAKIILAIKAIRNTNADYGYRRITLALKKQGFQVNHKRVLRIMKENDLLCHAYERNVHKYNSYKGRVGKVAPNRVNRRFSTDRPYQKVVTDVTELRWGGNSTNERAYFTAYIDLFNGEVLTWSLDLHPTVEFVVSPLTELLKDRPELDYRMTIHSDQGFQYQNSRYRTCLKEHRVFQSMSRKATCLDNACAESFFHQLKVGTVHNHHYTDFQTLKHAVKEYIQYYNYHRIKTKLAGMSPVEYRIHNDQRCA